MLLPPLFQALVVHVAKAQTTRFNLIILEASRFHNRALDSKDHPTPRAFIVMSSLLNEVLEQLYDDAQDKTQQRPLIIVVDNPDDDTSEWVKQRGERVEDRIDVVLWNDLISTGLVVEEKALREEKPFLVSLPGQSSRRGGWAAFVCAKLKLFFFPRPVFISTNTRPGGHALYMLRRDFGRRASCAHDHERGNVISSHLANGPHRPGRSPLTGTDMVIPVVTEHHRWCRRIPVHLSC
jgi:hypothetical protein